MLHFISLAIKTHQNSNTRTRATDRRNQEGSICAETTVVYMQTRAQWRFKITER